MNTTSTCIRYCTYLFVYVIQTQHLIFLFYMSHTQLGHVNEIKQENISTVLSSFGTGSRFMNIQQEFVLRSILEGYATTFA